eukprot:TRINITY_DN61255_c0_g1_i1.p1 TRINITY_DN61255_c0_g1~~TRINITY_DN61255_c0_g1_i1.p1  ORF type:complete len:239 (+),score=17.40 TRINITY_DN61255_c0_g1_i1:57-719(+)
MALSICSGKTVGWPPLQSPCIGKASRIEYSSVHFPIARSGYTGSPDSSCDGSRSSGEFPVMGDETDDEVEFALNSNDGESSYLPTIGSRLHGTGLCKPCVFGFRTLGCVSSESRCKAGQSCKFCHLCTASDVAALRAAKLLLMKQREEQISSKSDSDKRSLYNSSEETNHQDGFAQGRVLGHSELLWDRATTGGSSSHQGHLKRADSDTALPACVSKLSL